MSCGEEDGNLSRLIVENSSPSSVLADCLDDFHITGCRIVDIGYIVNEFV